MAYKKDRYQRLSIIYYELQKMVPITRLELLEKVNDSIDNEVTIHTIEKDVQCLKIDFDVETYQVGHIGIKLVEKIDFVSALLEHLKVDPRNFK